MFERRSAALSAAALLLAATVAPRADLPAEAQELLRAADAARTPGMPGQLRLGVRAGAGEGTGEESRVDVYLDARGAWLAVFRSGRQQGRRILSSGGRSWLLVPGARHAVPVSGEQRLAGAVAIADLVGLELAATYDATLREEREHVAGTACHVLDLAARAAGASFPRATLWVGAADRLPRRLELSLPSGKPARRIVFARWGERAGRPALERLVIEDLLRRRDARGSIVDVLGFEPRDLGPTLFTVEGARSVP